MHNDRLPQKRASSEDRYLHDYDRETAPDGGTSRREFLEVSAAGFLVGNMVGAGLGGSGLEGTALAQDFGRGGPPGRRLRRRVLLKGGTVLTMDPNVGDFEQADVLIEGSKIAAVGPNLRAAAQVIDARGMIVMPGLVDTHHHQYETIQRNIIPDGNLQWAGVAPQWPQEGYGTIVQSVWTTGRIGPEQTPIWDLGRSPYDPEDNYISELVASISQINQGVTLGIDTSQSSHTPEHTDAMIQGLMDSGRRSLFVYSGGRSDQPGYEFPGAIGDERRGLGRLRRQWFSSEDQAVTLGHQDAPPAGWELARAFDAVVVNHNNSNGQNLIDNQALLELFASEGRSIEQIHCARFTDEAYDVCARWGVHISIADVIEMQMGHGMPPFQACLDRGILPSLSSDVETNATSDPFSLMRAAFSLQRALLHQRAIPVELRGGGETGLPPVLTSYQVLQMATWSGAASAGLGHKVGRLVPGLEADIIVLNARSLSTWPLNNAPGAVVTMMDTSHVDTVFIGGRLMKWKGRLVGVNVKRLLDEIEASRDRVLARINGPATGSNPDAIDQFLNSEGHPYRPAFLGSCCAGEQTNVGTYDAWPGTGAGPRGTAARSARGRPRTRGSGRSPSTRKGTARGSTGHPGGPIATGSRR